MAPSAAQTTLSPSATETIEAPIHLQVGSHHFDTTKTTLSGASGYFRTLLGDDFKDPAQSDGSIFIDSDGDIFQHVLTYIRHGVFPLQFDEDNGHDLEFYRRVLDQARYFQVEGLITWLEEKRFETAARLIYTSEVVTLDVLRKLGRSDIGKTVHIDIKKIATEKRYLCSKGQVIVWDARTGHDIERVCSCNSLPGKLCVPVTNSYLEEDLYLVNRKTVLYETWIPFP